MEKVFKSKLQRKKSKTMSLAPCSTTVSNEFFTVIHIKYQISLILASVVSCHIGFKLCLCISIFFQYFFCITEFFNNNDDADDTHHNNDNDIHYNNDANIIFKYIVWGKYNKMRENSCPQSIG